MEMMEYIPLLLFALVFILILIGYPVALTLGGVSVIAGIIFFDVDFFYLLSLRIYGIMNNFVLLAVPLFIFMGITLEKSGIAEKLLETMALMFGRIKGGLAISVIIVGAMLAASTGIVGATVVTMGLISLPTMLKRGYSPSLATGVIASSGTLGQIIPPSVVLVLLGSVLNVSVGSLFTSALFPGVILVLLYLLYIIIISLIYPKLAPSMPENEIKKFHKETSFFQITKAFVLPFLLIGTVLGSIFLGIASPTEAAGVGALGAIILSKSNGGLKIKVLKEIMQETTHLTSTVFMILIGATSFSLVFRGLEGDKVLIDLITQANLSPNEFVILVLLIIFLAGFFIDFIEIIFIIVPVVVPIFIALDIDLIWVGILIAINLQTSFLTPPFGFSLFYLRGVAPKSIKTTQIWKGASFFIFLQLVGLGIVGFAPQLVNYLPLRSYYTSEVSPPPLNPKLQDCLIDYTYIKYNENFDESLMLTNSINSIDLNFIPSIYLEKLENSLVNIKLSKSLLENIKNSENEFNQFSEEYKPLHLEVRNIEKKIIKLNKKIEKIKKELRLETDDNEIDLLNNKIKLIEEEIINIKLTIPENWEEENKYFNNIISDLNKTKLNYNRTVDSSFNEISNLIKKFQNVDELASIDYLFENVITNINDENSEIEKILKDFEKKFNTFSDVSNVKKPIKKARKLLKKNFDKKDEAIELIVESRLILNKETEWRIQGKDILLNNLITLLNSGKETFGLRKQDQLNKEQALYLARCKSVPKDISLYF